MANLTPEDIRTLRGENPKMRDRDFADQNGLNEAELLAAYSSIDTTRIEAHPDRIIGAAQLLGEVMALTRNASCVHEKTGVYDNYHSGGHACMVLTPEIDLRIFPSHWRHGFLVEKETDAGMRRSLQVFDAAGDAVHKIFLRNDEHEQTWEALKSSLAIKDQSQVLKVEPRAPVEAAKSDPAKLSILRKEWTRMTDTHQFMRLTSKLKMNRLGAYRIVGAPFVRALRPEAINQMLHKLQDSETEVMVFVGNRGCIQIHNGLIDTLRPMGPWQNVMDPGFNLHLRLDHVAEVWAVEKPTQRGIAVSVEAFDNKGMLILQVFGVGKEGNDHRPAWGKLVETLDGLPEEVLS